MLFFANAVTMRGLPDIDLSSSPFLRVVRPEPPFVFGPPEIFFAIRSYLKYIDCVQGQGVDEVLKQSVHVVREHLKPNRTADIGRKAYLR